MGNSGSNPGGGIGAVVAAVGLQTTYSYTTPNNIAFDRVLHDPSSLWDATNFWFKVPSAGSYLITIQLGGGGANIGAEIFINGAQAVAYEAAAIRQDVKSIIWPLSANDEVSFIAGQSQSLSGSNSSSYPYGFACTASIARLTLS